MKKMKYPIVEYVNLKSEPKKFISEISILERFLESNCKEKNSANNKFE